MMRESSFTVAQIQSRARKEAVPGHARGLWRERQSETYGRGGILPLTLLERGKDLRLQGLRFALLVLALSAAFAQQSSAQQPPAAPALNPRWTASLPEPIMFAELIESDPAVLFVHAGRQVFAKDAATGRDLCPPIETGPALSYAGTALSPSSSTSDRSRVAYFYDRFTVYAVGIQGERVALKWRVGDWPDLKQRAEADPEFLSRIQAARAVDSGVLVVHSDGRTVLLQETEGQARVFPALPRPALCVIRASGDAATIFVTHDGRTVGYHLNCASGDLQPAAFAGDFTQPLWTDYSGSLVVAVWKDRIATSQPGEGSRSVVKFDTGRNLIALFREDDPAKDVLVIGSKTGVTGLTRPAAANMAGMFLESWHVSNRGSTGWQQVRMCGKAVLCTRSDNWQVLDARSGAVLAAAEADGKGSHQLISLSYQEGKPITLEYTRNGLALRRRPLALPPEYGADLATLGASGVRWRAGDVILIGSRHIVGYAVPR